MAIRAIGFDLGETLIGYGGIPLSWASLYRPALLQVAARCKCALDEQMLADAESILAGYNTRLHPRTIEVTSDKIIGAVLDCWSMPVEECLGDATDSFFAFFQQKAEPYPDVAPALEELKARGVRVGVLTDVPYGMGKQFVEMDLAPIARYVDVLLPSVEVGFRKPDPTGYLALASRLGVAAHEMAYVGNEHKDMIGAKSAGAMAVLIDRDGNLPDLGEDVRMGSLSELARRMEI